MKKKKKLRVEHKVIFENAYEIAERLSDACLQVYHDLALIMFLIGDEFDDIDLADIHTNDFYVEKFNSVIKSVAEEFKMKEEKLGWSVCTLDPCVELILLKCFFTTILDFKGEDDMTCKQSLEYGLDKLGDKLSDVELYIV